MKNCIKHNCLNKYYAKSFCRYHYDKEKRNANPDYYKTLKKEWNKNHKEHNARYRRNQYLTKGFSILDRYSRAKHNAKKRNKIFEISLEEFTENCNQKCYYCKGYFPPCKQGSGMDRIDNNKGYVTNNILPCCGFCNAFRSNKLSVEETQKLISLLKQLRSPIA